VLNYNKDAESSARFWREVDFFRQLDEFVEQWDIEVGQHYYTDMALGSLEVVIVIDLV
jgi:hypothetical protein